MTRWVQRAGSGMFAAALLAAALPVGAVGRTETDPRWLAWIGCWLPDGGGEDHILCVQPIDDDAAVRMVTYADGRIISEETVRADGEQRPTQREGCNGWESARFSDDGRRIYIRSEFACGGEVRRSSSGLISMASPMMWLDVQSVGVAGQNAVRVVRYRLASPELLESEGIEPLAEDRPMAVSTARTAVSAPLSVDAVIDASANVAPEAVEAWIFERGDRLALNADALVEMADAGVPESVIDLAIAVSFPGTFAIDSERDSEFRVAEMEDEEYRRPDHYAYPGYYDPFYWDPFRYSRYGRYYSPYGWGGYGWYPGYRPVIVIVDPDDDGQATPPGRVVRGRGYTRGGRTVSEPSGGSYRAPPSRSSGTVTTTRPSTGSSSGSAAPPRRARPRGGSSGTGTGTGGI